jgi:hypothetical protein
MESICIALDPGADELQRFAADELRRYLRRLFNLDARIGDRDGRRPCFLLGRADAPWLNQACPQLPELSDQGILLRRLDRDTFLLAGGGSAAVAWAVYELAERYGVTYLLHGDLFPAAPGPFRLPDLDLRLEPNLRLRAWRQFNDLPTGPALWSLAQQQAFIRQIFKLKFNGIYLCLWPHHPFVDFEFQGIRRQTATLLFGQKIPIDEETIGRRHLPPAPFLDNPELLGAATYQEKLAAGRRLIAGILDQARFFRMHTAIHVQPLEFPAEFRPLLQRPTEAAIQLGGLTCAERGDLTHPNHIGLIQASLDALLAQWGEVDEFHLSLPEHPHADRQFRQCWQELDRRHHLEPDYSLEDLLALGARNYLIPGGLARAEREFKSSISMLHFFDRFFAGGDYLQRAAARGIAVHLNLGGNTESLFPILERVLWPGAGIATSLGYTASRAVRAMRCMESLDPVAVPAALIVTLQDDNVGSLPQVATENIHHLVRGMQRLGWRGFLTRHWPIGDLDPVAAYLSRASWDTAATPATAYQDHFTRVYGTGAAGEMGQAMRLLEDATVILDLDFLSLFFPVLGIMDHALNAETPMPEGLFHVRALYEEAQRLLERAAAKAASGRSELAYWQSRLEFAVQALIEKEKAHEGGLQLHASRRAADEQSRRRHLEAAAAHYRQAMAAGEAALRAAAAQVRDDSDRATLAAYHHFFVREVSAKAAELLAGRTGTADRADPM